MRRVVAAICSAGLLMAVFAPGIAAGGPPVPVTIVSEMHSVQDSANEGWFEITGTDLVCARGAVYDVGYVFGAYRPGHLREIIVTKAFVCNDDDAFLVRMQVHEDLVTNTERFTWVVLKGFGAFAGLNGRGDGTTTTTNIAQGPWMNTYEGFLVY